MVATVRHSLGLAHIIADLTVTKVTGLREAIPDLGQTEQASPKPGSAAKPQHSTGAFSNAIGRLFDLFSPEKSANNLTISGYPR